MCVDSLDCICRMQALTDLAERYILSCRQSRVGQKNHERFPNVAGFCRFCGFDGTAIERLRRDYPDSYSALCLVFEDEALNSDIPASILSVYLKKRLGYENDSNDSASSCDVGQLKLVFEHDIATDGE